MNKKQKRGLYVLFSDYSHHRGGEKYLYELLFRIRKEYNVVLVVEKISSLWKKKYVEAGMQWITLPTSNHLYWELLPITFFRQYFFLKGMVNSTDTLFAANFPLSLLALALSKRTIVFCFEPFSIFHNALRLTSAPFKERLILSFVRFVWKPFDVYVIRRANMLVTLNDDVAHSIHLVYGRRPTLFVHNGVDTTRFSPNKKPLLVFKGRRVIGHSTDFSPLKGTEILLRALPNVIQKYKNVFLVISESVPNKQMRKQYLRLARTLGIANHVRFIGTVSEKGLPRFYRSLDVFCFCGPQQCVGSSAASLSVLEAQSCEIPVLRTQGNSDEIIPGKTGFYFSSESPSDVAAGICLFFSLSPGARHSLGKEGRKFCSTHFSWNGAAESLKNLLQKSNP